MTRRALIAGLTLLVVAAVGALWLGGAAKHDDVASLSSDKGAVPSQSPARAVPARPMAEMPVLVDDDVEGTLRLEGQVIDGDDQPVAGARVTIDSNPPRTSKTEQDGSFVFDKLVGRRYSLVATAMAGVAGPVTARLTTTSDPIVLRLLAGAAVDVRVVRAVDGRPVAGATVEARGLITRTAIADGDGVARLTALPAGRFQLAASAPGYALASQWLALRGPQATEQRTIELRRGASVSGRVIGPGGRPVAGAAVLYEGVSDWSLRASRRHDAAVSAEDGTFRIDALSAGTVRLRASHPQFAPGVTEPMTLDGRTSTSDVVIVLDQGASISGVVVDRGGAPVGWATVRVAAERRRFAEARQATADDQGRFEIGALPRAVVHLVAVNDTASSDTAEIDLTSSPRKDGVQLRLEIDGRIAGVVVDGAGEPVEGAQVMARPDFRRGGGRGRRGGFEWQLRGVPQELTDAAGRFEFSGLQDMAYRVVAAPPAVNLWGRGWRGGDRGGAVTAQVGDTNLRLVLEKDGSIAGKVVFEDGSVPAAYIVAIGRFGGGTPFSAKDGSFSLADVPPGTHRLAISGPGFEDTTIGDVEVGAGQTKNVGTIQVRRGNALAGRVVNATGQPIEGARVSAGRRISGTGSDTSAAGRFGGRAPTKTATTDADGEFVIRGLPAGQLSVIAEHEVHGRSVPVVAVGTGQGGGALQLTLRAFGAVEGAVTRGGIAEEGAFVQAQSKTVVTTTFAVQTGADGRYRFDRLAPDNYLLSVSAAGGPRGGRAAESASAQVESGGTVRVDIELGAGNGALLVIPTTTTGERAFARVSAVQGLDVTATTAAQLAEELGRRESGFSAVGFSDSRGPARLAGMPGGSYSVCAVAFPQVIDGMRDAFAYESRAGDRLPVYCTKVEVDGRAGEMTVELAVDLPAFIPED